MITVVTSKRGGTGCTSLALVYSILLSKQKRKVCMVDLKSNNDIVKLLKIKTNSSIDNLLSEFGVHNKFSGLEDNICTQGGLDVIPGSVVNMKNYLLTKASKIKDLLLILEGRYDDVILDLEDGDLLEVLSREDELNFLKINVIDQNMLTILEYQQLMDSPNFDGFLIVNKMEGNIFPQKRLFTEKFQKGKLFFIPVSSQFKNNVNREGVTPSSVNNTEVLNSMVAVVNAVLPVINSYNSKINIETSTVDEGLVFENDKPKEEPKKKKKKGFSFFGLFKKGGK